MPSSQQEYNRILNILDPPKDLSVSKSPLKDTAHGGVIKAQIKTLFSPNDQLPPNYVAVGDTKKQIKTQLGSESDATNAQKPLTKYLLEKANKIRILRESHSTGCDARPSNLNVSQDSGPGPSSIIKDPKIIITPGTIMDPATKTKEGAAYLVKDYGELPYNYVKELYMDSTIKEEIVMTEETTSYRIKIPTNIGGEPTITEAGTKKDGPGMINALLDKGTFQKYTAGANPDGVYFEGNATKNENIFNLFNVAPASGAATLKGTAAEVTLAENEIKKYILVKELGDSLQVIWLKYILDVNGETGTYTASNTVLSTGDTVVWYRCIINKIPVIVTYMGVTNYWRAQDNDAVMIAAFKKTIRDELISQNNAVIETIEEVIKIPRDSQNLWILGMVYTKDPYDKCIDYLTKLVKKLKSLNSDALLFIEKVQSIEAAKAVSADYHLVSPFTKKGTTWKTNDTVTHLLPNKRLAFHAKLLKFPSTIISRLLDTTLFESVAEQTGGGQIGGARETITNKLAAINNVKNKDQAKDYMEARWKEWKFKASFTWPEELPQSATIAQKKEREEIVGNINKRVKEARDKRKGTIQITGNESNFMKLEIEQWVLLSNNSETTTTTPPTAPKTKAENYVLYLLVRDNYPEIFTYAAMMKTGFNSLIKDINDQIKDLDAAGITVGTRTAELSRLTPLKQRAEQMRDKFKNTNVDISLVNKFKLEYNTNKLGKMLITGQDYVVNEVDITNSATKEAIFLANQFLTDFNYLKTKELANFLDYAIKNLFSTNEKTNYSIAPTAEEYASFQTNIQLDQEGGGNEMLNSSVTDFAMDNYEIYYSMAIKAAYEDRDVTPQEFEDELIRIQKEVEQAESKKIVISEVITNKKPLSLLNKLRTLKSRIPMQNTMGKIRKIITEKTVRPSTSYITEGGRRRYKKTQKKRKSKQRKTRRSRG